MSDWITTRLGNEYCRECGRSREMCRCRHNNEPRARERTTADWYEAFRNGGGWYTNPPYRR
jgi:hypothetical protein